MPQEDEKYRWCEEGQERAAPDPVTQAWHSPYLYSLSCRISTGSSPLGFWMGVIRFCFWWSCTMGAGWAGCPGDCVWGGITGDAAGGTAGGAGEGRPVGWGGISF